jgi:hypothetical protein
MEAAKDQEVKISQLDRSIETLRGVASPDATLIRTEVNRQEEKIYDNFNAMTARLSQVEEGISRARKNLEGQLRSNAEVNEKLDLLTGRLEKIEQEEGGYNYRGTQEDLQSEMEDFQKLLSQLEVAGRGATGQIDFAHKTQIQEPLNTFETKMMLHNKNNE